MICNEIGGGVQARLFEYKSEREQRSFEELKRLLEKKKYNELDYIDVIFLKRQLIKT